MIIHKKHVFILMLFPSYREADLIDKRINLEADSHGTASEKAQRKVKQL